MLGRSIMEGPLRNSVYIFFLLMTLRAGGCWVDAQDSLGSIDWQLSDIHHDNPQIYYSFDSTDWQSDIHHDNPQIYTPTAASAVRLMNGTSLSDYQGRVEVYDGSWQTLCVNPGPWSRWTRYEADVVCRMLNYSQAFGVYRSSDYLFGGGEFMLEMSLYCVGNEDNYLQCDHETGFTPDSTSNSTSDGGSSCETVGLSCAHDPDALLEFRFAKNGSRGHNHEGIPEGVLEVNINGWWASFRNWEPVIAKWLCQYIGYDDVSHDHSYGNDGFGLGTWRLTIDAMECTPLGNTSHCSNKDPDCMHQLLQGDCVFLTDGDGASFNKPQMGYQCISQDFFPCSGSNMSVSVTLVCDGYYNCDNYEDESLCNYSSTYLQEGESYFIYTPSSPFSRLYNVTLLRTNAMIGFRVVIQDLYMYLYDDDQIQIGTGNDPSDIQSVITTIHGPRDYANDVYVDTNEMWFAVVGAKGYTSFQMDVEIISIDLSTLFDCSSSNMSVSPTVLCDGLHHCDHFEDELACNISATFLQEGDSYFISLPFTHIRLFYNVTLLQTNTTNGFRVVFQDLYLYNDNQIQIGTGNDPSDIQSVITTIHGYRDYANDVYVDTNEMWFAVVGAKCYTSLEMDVEFISIDLTNPVQNSSKENGIYCNDTTIGGNGTCCTSNQTHCDPADPSKPIDPVQNSSKENGIYCSNTTIDGNGTCCASNQTLCDSAESTGHNITDPTRIVRLASAPGALDPDGNRVEIYTEGIWKPVCGERRSFSHLRVICATLGYQLFRVVQSIPFDDEGLDVQCPQDAVHISQCTWSSTFCRFTQGATCLPEMPPMQLSNGTRSSQGRVEMFFADQWMPFNGARYWNRAHTDPICQELGYPWTIAIYNDGTFGFVEAMFADNEICDTYGCIYWKKYKSKYQRVAALGLACYEEDHEITAETLIYQDSKILAFDLGSGVLRPICVDDMVHYNDPAVTQLVHHACRSLGAPKALMIKEAEVQPEWNRFFQHVYCPDGGLITCTFYAMSMQCNGVLEVHCNNGSDIGVHLGGGEGDFQGRVELSLEDGSGLTGSVCGLQSEDFYHLVCRSLGYESAVYTTPNYAPSGTLRTEFQKVICPFNAGRLSECFINNLLLDDRCSEDNFTLAVVCNSAEALPVRLVDTNGTGRASSGIVEVRIFKKWESICSNQVTKALISPVLCLQLGYSPYNFSVWSTSIKEESSFQDYLVSFGTCATDARDLRSCFLDARQDWVCSPENRLDLGISCDPEPLNPCNLKGALYPCDELNGGCTPNGTEAPICWCREGYALQSDGHTCKGYITKVRLMDGTGPDNGRLEVYFKEDWTLVFTYGWQKYLRLTLDVFCRMLGFERMFRVAEFDAYDQGRDGIIIFHVECPPDASSIQNCSYHTLDALTIGIRLHLSCQTGQTLNIRLANGSAPSNGRVELQYLGNWSSVTFCLTSSSAQETSDFARVTCNSLGYANQDSWSTVKRLSFAETNFENPTCETTDISTCQFGKLSTCHLYYPLEEWYQMLVTCREESSLQVVSGFLPSELQESFEALRKALFDDDSLTNDTASENVDSSVAVARRLDSFLDDMLQANITELLHVVQVDIELVALAMGTELDVQSISFGSDSESRAALPEISIPIGALLRGANVSYIAGAFAVIKLKTNGTDPVHHNISDSSQSGFLNSDVVSIKLLGVNTTSLKENVTISFPLAQPSGGSYSPHCGFLEQNEVSDSTWSLRGCERKKQEEGADSDDVVTCSCNHLTSFAILMLTDIDEVAVSDQHAFILSIMTYVGLSLSITALTLSLMAFFISRIQTTRLFLMKNQCIVMIMAQLLFATGVEPAKGVKVACGIIAGVTHLLFLAVFAWMMNQGLYILLQLGIQRLTHVHIRRWKYFILGWGIPAVIVVITSAVDYRLYVEGEYCWLATVRGGVYAFIGPVVAVLLINIAIFCYAIIAFTSVKAFKNKTEKDKIRSTLRAVSVLCPILGITWVMGLFVDIHISLQYSFTILNSSQGVLLFIFQVLLNDEVYVGVRRRLRRHHIYPLGFNEASVTDHKSMTKQTLSTGPGTKTSSEESGNMNMEVVSLHNE